MYSDDTPDSKLAVRFYSKSIKNEFESAKEGRPIFDMRDFVRIEVPGDRNSIIDTFVNETHKLRFPFAWQKYMNAKQASGEFDQMHGTPLEEWPILSSANALEMRHFKFYTVEQVASASDEQIMAIGMAGGMSPYVLRDKAKAFLDKASESAISRKMENDLKERDEKLAAQEAEMASMREAINKLIAAQESKPRGRPAKEPTE